MILLAVMGSMPFVLTTIQSTRHAYMREQNFDLAEAGVAHARKEIANGAPNFPSAIGAPAINGWTKRANSECEALDGAESVDPQKVYGVTVNSCHTFTSPAIAAGDVDNGVAGPAIGTYSAWVVNAYSPDTRIISRGNIANSPTSTRTITVDLQRPLEIIRYGLFSEVQVTVGNRGPVFLDSYKSSLGPYNHLTPNKNGGIGSNGTGMTDAIRILQSTVDVKGVLNAPSGKNIAHPAGWNPDPAAGCSPPATCPQGYNNGMTPITLPHVVIPTALAALPVTTTFGGAAGVTESGQGDFKITGTYTCDAPLHVRSFYVTGTLLMTNNCQLYVDATEANGTIHEPAYKPGGAAIDTDGTGSLLKTGSGTTQIFVRNRGIDFDGGGVAYDSAVPVANRIPANLQIFVTCSGVVSGTCANNTIPGPNNVAQRNPFYGVIYVEGGVLNVYRASENGISYDTNYYGAFASNGTLNIEGLDGTSPYVHFDEDLIGLSLDGSGIKGYRVKAGSWNMP